MFDGKIPVVTMVNGHMSSNISGRKQILQFANISTILFDDDDDVGNLGKIIKKA